MHLDPLDVPSPSPSSTPTPRAERRTWARRLARHCVAPFAGTALSPNHITSVRIVIGAGACLLLAWGTRHGDIWAGALWLVAVLLDRADGEFARMTGRTSAFGHRLDYASDVVLSALFFIAAGIGARAELGNWGIAAGIAAAIGVTAAQVFAEAIDLRQAASGEKAFPGIDGFDFEDATLAFALVVWAGWHGWFVAAASVGAPAFAAFAWVRLQRVRSPEGVGGSRAVWAAVMLLLGACLVVVAVRSTDLDTVGRHLGQLDIGAVAALLGLYLLRTVADAVSWHLTLPSMPAMPRALYRLWTILMAGGAIVRGTPLGGLGGESLKVIVLRRRHGIPYPEAAASLVLTRTTDVVALVVFVGLGLGVAAHDGVLPGAVAVAAGAGLLTVAAAFVLVQRLGLVARCERRLGPARGPTHLPRMLRALARLEDALAGFYAEHPGRFLLSVVASACELAIGMLAVYLALHYLGHPASMTDALAIEAIVLLVTAALFFVPGNLGTQEGALTLACEVLLGSPALGLALAAIRRGRDVLWIAAGFGLASWHSLYRGAEHR